LPFFIFLIKNFCFDFTWNTKDYFIFIARLLVARRGSNFIFFCLIAWYCFLLFCSFFEDVFFDRFDVPEVKSLLFFEIVGWSESFFSVYWLSDTSFITLDLDIKFFYYCFLEKLLSFKSCGLTWTLNWLLVVFSIISSCFFSSCLMISNCSFFSFFYVFSTFSRIN